MSVDLDKGVGAAKHAGNAALDLDGVATVTDCATIDLAVVGVVDGTFPQAIAGWFHADQNGQADQRPLALGGIGVFAVNLGLAVDLADRLGKADNASAEVVAAIRDFHSYLSIGHRPNAIRCRLRQGGSGKHGGKKCGKRRITVSNLHVQVPFVGPLRPQNIDQSMTHRPALSTKGTLSP